MTSYTPKQVAFYAHRARSTVRRAILRGKLHAPKVGKYRTVDEAEMKRWAALTSTETRGTRRKITP